MARGPRRTTDPARSLALLWRTGEQVGHRGKPGLSVDRIVDAATGISDREGLDALSMRKVAESLGVGTMSLYTYVPGKSDLVNVMLDSVHSGLAAPGPRVRGWRARLHATAHGIWDLYRRHTWILEAARGRPVLGPHLMAKYERELRELEGLGLTAVEMDSVVGLVNGYVEGAVARAVAGEEVERRTGITDEQWWRAHAPVLSRIVDVDRFPTAARVGAAAGAAHGSAYDPMHGFEFGLARVLDGIDVLVRSRAGEGERGEPCEAALPVLGGAGSERPAEPGGDRAQSLEG
ncbi:AcrR family transcriptional regulator [Nocardiopsis arvandica]|uniref:AcrR family transcriptional regulator n=1 Tax=Nocardiopsis sinuspersici TaxID=501010 RepID=A0A7Y9XH26_9ACTN|nr:TetR/AcrR family transcriptional regulator [Nocardiopsis sinuspersici]NYH55689.1 AcrR family transcriptional regulator [Nocardiopsis sinuspersici]